MTIVDKSFNNSTTWDISTSKTFYDAKGYIIQIGTR